MFDFSLSLENIFEHKLKKIYSKYYPFPVLLYFFHYSHQIYYLVKDLFNYTLRKNFGNCNSLYTVVFPIYVAS